MSETDELSRRMDELCHNIDEHCRKIKLTETKTTIVIISMPFLCGLGIYVGQYIGSVFLK